MRIYEIIYSNVIEEDRLPPVIRIRDATSLLHKAGFVLVRAAKHKTWEHPDGRKFQIPHQDAYTISPGITNKLYKLLGMK